MEDNLTVEENALKEFQEETSILDVPKKMRKI
jgi:hypothetical protein